MRISLSWEIDVPIWKLPTHVVQKTRWSSSKLVSISGGRFEAARDSGRSSMGTSENGSLSHPSRMFIPFPKNGIPHPLLLSGLSSSLNLCLMCHLMRGRMRSSRRSSSSVSGRRRRVPRLTSKPAWKGPRTWLCPSNPPRTNWGFSTLQLSFEAQASQWATIAKLRRTKSPAVHISWET
jgi:hypothetical protein